MLVSAAARVRADMSGDAAQSPRVLQETGSCGNSVFGCFVQTVPSRIPAAAELLCAVSRVLEPFQGWD